MFNSTNVSKVMPALALVIAAFLVAVALVSSPATESAEAQSCAFINGITVDGASVTKQGNTYTAVLDGSNGNPEVTVKTNPSRSANGILIPSHVNVYREPFWNLGHSKVPVTKSGGSYVGDRSSTVKFGIGDSVGVCVNGDCESDEERKERIRAVENGEIPEDHSSSGNKGLRVTNQRPPMLPGETRTLRIKSHAKGPSNCGVGITMLKVVYPTAEPSVQGGKDGLGASGGEPGGSVPRGPRSGQTPNQNQGLTPGESPDTKKDGNGDNNGNSDPPPSGQTPPDDENQQPEPVEITPSEEQASDQQKLSGQAPEEQNTQTEEQETPPEGQNTQTEEQETQPEEQNTQTEEQETQPEEQNTQTEDQETPREEQNTQTEEQETPREEQNPQTEEQETPPDDQKQPEAKGDGDSGPQPQPQPEPAPGGPESKAEATVETQARPPTAEPTVEPTAEPTPEQSPEEKLVAAIAGDDGCVSQDERSAGATRIMNSRWDEINQAAAYRALHAAYC